MPNFTVVLGPRIRLLRNQAMQASSAEETEHTHHQHQYSHAHQHEARESVQRRWFACLLFV
jgi:hypothetical protein